MKRYRIIEDDGADVPPSERYFTTGPGLKAPYQTFWTLSGAKYYLSVEHYVPADQIDIELVSAL